MAAGAAVIGIVAGVGACSPALLGSPGALVLARAVAADCRIRAGGAAIAAVLVVVDQVDACPGAADKPAWASAGQAAALGADVGLRTGRATAAAVLRIALCVDTRSRATLFSCYTARVAASAVPGVRAGGEAASIAISHARGAAADT